MRTKIEFPSQGQHLAGLLETPDQAIRAYAVSYTHLTLPTTPYV